MKTIVKRRGIRYSKKLNGLEELPDMKGVTLVVMAIVECEWLQYILYYDNHQTYSVDLPNQKDWLKFHKWLDGKFKAAGVKPKCAKGFLDHYWG